MASQLIIAGGIENLAVANVYDSEASYQVGDYCTYHSAMYVCKEATSGEFDEAKWESTTCADKIETIESQLANALYVVSFDASTGTLVTRSADYTA